MVTEILEEAASLPRPATCLTTDRKALVTDGLTGSSGKPPKENQSCVYVEKLDIPKVGTHLHLYGK